MNKLLETYIKSLVLTEAKGIFEPPPEMYRAMVDWLYSIMASHVWTLAEEKMERKGQTIEDVDDYFQNIYDEIPSVLDSLDNGKSYRWRISGPGENPHFIGVRRISDNVEEWKSNNQEQKGDGPPYFVYGTGSKRITFEGEWWDSRDKESTIRVLRGNFERRHNNISAATRRRDKFGEVRTDNTKVEELIEECKKYTSKPKKYVAKAMKSFDVDTTGWSYIKGKKFPILKVLNIKIEQDREDHNKAIEHGKMNLEAAQAVWEDYRSGNFNGDIAGDMLMGKKVGIEMTNWNMGSKYTTYIQPYYRLANMEEWLLPKDSKMPSKVYVYDVGAAEGMGDEEFITLEEAEAKIKEKYTEKDIDKAIHDATAWKKIKVIADFMGHKKRGGVWKMYDLQMEVDMPHVRSVIDIEMFNKVLWNIERTARHEIQHVGQDLLQMILGLKIPAGLPPKRVMDPDNVSQKNFNPRGIEHGLKDIEFQTDLADEIKEFNKDIAGMDNDDLIKDRLRWFVGVNGLATSRFFEILKRNDKEKWHLAVKKLMKNIE